MKKQDNLPELVQYRTQIKVIQICRFLTKITGKSEYAYYIKFIEEHEEIIPYKHLKIFNKTKVIKKEIERIIPFSFKSFEIAKDFAQCIPNMKISGIRFHFNTTYPQKNNVAYETFKICVNGIDAPIYIKFKNEHQTYDKRSENHIYYINDLDKKYINGEFGNFYKYDELIVDYFFQRCAVNVNEKILCESTMHVDEQFETITDIKNNDLESIHKFILIENN